MCLLTFPVKSVKSRNVGFFYLLRVSAWCTRGTAEMCTDLPVGPILALFRAAQICSNHGLVTRMQGQNKALWNLNQIAVLKTKAVFPRKILRCFYNSSILSNAWGIARLL